MIAKRARAGSCDHFERKFKPIEHDGESLIWDWGDLPKPVDIRRTWTVIDCDGKLYVIAGLHYVNRIGYLRSAVPWQPVDELREWRYD